MTEKKKQCKRKNSRKDEAKDSEANSQERILDIGTVCLTAPNQQADLRQRTYTDGGKSQRAHVSCHL